jgi:hypothetical protein
MRSIIGKRGAMLLAGLVLMLLLTGSPSTANSASTVALILPNPVLIYMGPEFYQANGKQWTRYKFSVFNLMSYPKELFAAAPDLPPCGTNTKASRTWVDVYEQTGKRLYGFCALGKPEDLDKLWFALERDVLPPSWIYIEMTDRKTNTKYKSNLAETVE